MGKLLELEGNLFEVMKEIRDELGSPNDLTIREVALAGSFTRCAVVFLCGLTDKDNVYKYVIRTLQYEEIINEEAVVQTLLDRFISIAEVGVKTKFPDIMNAILAGDTVILIDNIQTAIVINSSMGEAKFRTTSDRRFNTRPRVGLNEDINVNKMLIRRSLRDPKLRFQSYIMGKRSQKEVTLVYIEDIINPHIVKELDRRLQSIVTDVVLETGTIEQLIQDNNLSPFPQF